jgi:glycosyltransferase involved in cell wall biosynthesis
MFEFLDEPIPITSQQWREGTIPLVSISCLTYNHENYIRDAIEGFLMQKTTFPVEILIHDDASTDKTAEIVREYEKKYPQLIKAIYQTENQYSKGIGVSTTFQFPRARGKYIALCEGDDYWTDPLKLQKQVDFLEENNEFGLVYTDVDFYYQYSKKFKKAVFKNNHIYQCKSFEDHLINKGYLAPLTWVFRKDIYDSFEIKVSHSDGSFAIMLEFFYHSKVFFLNKVTAVYRISEGSVSRPKKLINKYKYHMGVFQTQIDYLNKYIRDDENTRKRLLTGGYFMLYPMALRLNDNKTIKEIEEYMESQNITIEPIKTMIDRNNKIEKIIEFIKKYKLYPLVKLFIKSI